MLIPGKIRNEACRALLEDYGTRCGRLGVPLQLVPVKAEDESRPAQEALAREARALLARVPEGYRVVALEERGQLLDSQGFAQHLALWREQGVAGVAFVVGSARGLGEPIHHRADLRLSLSRMTFPHELAVALLSEQLYRGLSILAGHPYHKE